MSARGSQDRMKGEVWQVIRMKLSLEQIYLELFLVFQCLSLGDGASCQGNQGVEKDPARYSTGEVDDMFAGGDVRHGQQGVESLAVQLAAPNPAVGDRKRLMEELTRMPRQFVQPVIQLVEKLDDLFGQSPSTVAEMERLEAEAEVILDVVRAYARTGKGRQYETAVIDVIGAPKSPSTIVTNEKNIGNKILPWLRSYLQEKKPGFKVTDLIAFGRPNFTRLQEEMVLECNNNVGKTSATKRGVLVSWTVLCRAIGEAVRESIDDLGDDAVRSIQHWYEDLATRVGHGVTRMKTLYERARTEKSQSQEMRDQMPMDEVIKKWILSDERSVLQQELRDTAKAIQNGGAVKVSARAYTSYSELIITEMSVYGPVRIGAVSRATVRMFLRSMPAWSAKTHGFDRSRRVTLPPPNGCQHQRHQNASDAAKCGLKETGEKCCEQAIPPTCFLMPNDKDKGGKSNTYIAIPGETHALVGCFLTVRSHYFEHNKPEGGKNLQGTCAIFLSAKGKDPRETSDFKLTIFNRAVFGEKSRTHVTPQQLRSWNTTYLNNHPDAQVAAMRGEATGNTDVVFQQHYNLAKQSGVLEALLASFGAHRDEEAPVQWSQEHDERRKHDQVAIEEANSVLLYKEDGTDLTSKSKPVHRHLRKQFQEELERVDPGLWERAGGGEKGMALSEMKWVNEVVSVLGRAEAEQLRDIIFQQYRGHEDPLRRRWSSLFSHLETMKKDRLRGGNSTHNCPLVATLKMFYSSACYANKRAGGQQGSGGDDRSSNDEE